MLTHAPKNGVGLPICGARSTGEGVLTNPSVDFIDCVDCLRMLAKSAVQFGNGRNAVRSVGQLKGKRK